MPKRKKLKKPHKISKHDLWFRIILGLSLISGAAVLTLFTNNAEFFQGFTGGIELSIEEVAPEPQDIKLGTILGHYQKQDNDIELTIGDENVEISKIEYTVLNEPLRIETFVFQMDGTAVNQNFSNIRVVFRNEEVSDINVLWDENMLIVHLGLNPIIIEPGIEVVSIFVDIANGNQGETAEFHLADMTAIGTITGESIFGYGLNGALVPMPQRFILK